MSVLTGAVYRGGRPVPGFALGDADPFANLLGDLASMRTDATAATNAANAGDYAGAVAKFQAIGQHGADVLGPAIDAVGPPTKTQPFTQDAWRLNAALAQSSSDADGATQARVVLNLILGDYTQAIDAAQQVWQQQRPPTGLPMAYVLIPAGIFVLLGGIWMLVKR